MQDPRLFHPEYNPPQETTSQTHSPHVEPEALSENVSDESEESDDSNRYVYPSILNHILHLINASIAFSGLSYTSFTSKRPSPQYQPAPESAGNDQSDYANRTSESRRGEFIPMHVFLHMLINVSIEPSSTSVLGLNGDQ